MAISPLALAGIALAVVAAAPFTLPQSAHFERSAFSPAPSDAIYAILSTSSRFNPFRDADPDLAFTYSGPDAGIGAKFAVFGSTLT